MRIALAALARGALCCEPSSMSATADRERRDLHVCRERGDERDRRAVARSENRRPQGDREDHGAGHHQGRRLDPDGGEPEQEIPLCGLPRRAAGRRSLRDRRQDRQAAAPRQRHARALDGLYRDRSHRQVPAERVLSGTHGDGEPDRRGWTGAGGEADRAEPAELPCDPGRQVEQARAFAEPRLGPGQPVQFRCRDRNADAEPSRPRSRPPRNPGRAISVSPTTRSSSIC